MTIQEYLKNNTLLFDGGMGTYYSDLTHMPGAGCEEANLFDPELITKIHTEYIQAGCRAIKTNTFAANSLNYADEQLSQIIEAGWSLARKAAGEDVFVFADIGPVSVQNDRISPADEYMKIADLFLAQGARYFLFETNPCFDGLAEAARYIKTRQPDAYIIASFAVLPDGYSRDGIYASELIAAANDCAEIDAVGLNCVCGVRHMLELVQSLDHHGKTLSLMPNAGYPIVINSRTYYESDPVYFASQLASLAAEGASILGGCCGTTPVFLAEAAEQLAKGNAVPVVRYKKAAPVSPAQDDNLFYNKLTSGKKVITVELDPPADINLSKFMKGAWELKECGTDLITIADCPIARARMDSSLLACKVHRELGIDTIPHMTCRDRNINATKALVLGLYAEGVHNALLITGDPIPTAERDEVKSVYQFNSRKMAAYLKSISDQTFPTPMHLYGALNVNARNFNVQLDIAKDKLEKGMIGFFTQPILTEQAFENLKLARAELSGYIFGGIIPVVSAKNARFMDSEISGINVDPKLIDMYEGKNREECEALAVSISAEIARQIAPYVDGYYLMTPFQRTGLMAKIISEIRKQQ